MNISHRFAKAIEAIVGKESHPLEPITDDKEVLANGVVFSDKRDVEDPTTKFSGIRFVSRQGSTKRNRDNVDFFRPEYDLPTIANAVQLDGLLRRAVNVFVEQIMKNGFECVSRNERIQRHVDRRLREIELLTGISLYEVLIQAAHQLVTYGNAYIIKVRSEAKTKYGKQFRLYGKDTKPIVGLFVAEATTMEIGLNPQGTIVQYRHSVRGQEDYFDERDVIHLAYNKIPGTLTGMSTIISVLDDVRALRKLEEEIEILGFQYSIPLYLYKVGNKDIPPAPGEVDAVSAEINSMPAYGMLVVPGHHTIEVPSNTNTPVDILAFVNHFKRRIFAGLGISPVAMGDSDTSNRNTSEVLDVSMQTVTKLYQNTFKYKLENGFLNELLLDGGFYKIEDTIEFNYPEIDLEQQIKFETNIISKWQNNLITLDEARNEMDYDKKMDESRTFLQLVELPKLQEQGKIDSKLAKDKAAISQKVAPSNQHGKSTGRPKYKKDSLDVLNGSINAFINDLYDSQGISDVNLVTLQTNIISAFSDEINKYINECILYYKKELTITDQIDDQELITSYIDHIKDILHNKIKYYSKRSIDGHLLASELSDFITEQEKKVDSLAKILIYKSLGFKTILVNVDACEKHSLKNIKIADINYHKLPPFAYGCNCTIDETCLYELIGTS